MKKLSFFAIIMAVFCFSFVACNNKQHYKNSVRSLDFLWSNLQGNGVNLPLSDTIVMYIASSLNYYPSLEGVETLTIQCNVEDSTIYRLCVEKTSAGWMAEKNPEFFSKNEIDNLRPLNKEEERYIKIAYNSVMQQ